MQEALALEEWSEIHISAPSRHRCPICAAAHEAQSPHDRDSLYYIYRFYRRNKRLPSWADAMSHCSELTKAATRAALMKRGVSMVIPDVHET